MKISGLLNLCASGVIVFFAFAVAYNRVHHSTGSPPVRFAKALENEDTAKPLDHCLRRQLPPKRKPASIYCAARDGKAHQHRGKATLRGQLLHYGDENERRFDSRSAEKSHYHRRKWATLLLGVTEYVGSFSSSDISHRGRFPLE
jgi:hypothetical protein